MKGKNALFKKNEVIFFSKNDAINVLDPADSFCIFVTGADGKKSIPALALCAETTQNAVK